MEKHIWRPVYSISNSRPSPRWGHRCCTVGDDLVILEAMLVSHVLCVDSVYMNDVWVYQTYSMQWSEVRTFG
jgi:hypothetical protein